MGALKGSVTVRRYLVKGEAPSEQARVVKGVRAHALVPIDPRSDVVRSHGWAWLEDMEETDLDSDKIFVSEAVALTMRVDTLKPPAAAVKRLVAENIKALGRKPTRNERDALRLEAIRKLRLQIPPTVKNYDMVWLMDTNQVLFFSHGKTPNELMMDLFFKSFGLELSPDGPGEVARDQVPATTPLAPTPEMVSGFAGLPGRSFATSDDDDAGEEADA